MTEKLFWTSNDQAIYNETKKLTVKELVDYLTPIVEAGGYTKDSMLIQELRKKVGLSHEVTNAIEYDEIVSSGCPKYEILEVKV